MSYDEEENLKDPMLDDLDTEDEPLDLPEENFDDLDGEEDPDDRYH
ncbi:MAG: hypothetical protein WC822_05485 [Candidatus Paceibacterota bacterium]|jgi:hypothetical protein